MLMSNTIKAAKLRRGDSTAPPSPSPDTQKDTAQQNTTPSAAGAR
jgi:hypothetical protein